MKLCFISSNSIHTKRWVEYFAKNGHEVHVILNKKAEYEGCKTYLIDGNPLVKAVKIKQLVNKINPGIVHSHQVTPFGLYGMLSRGNKPFVVTAWGSDIFLIPEKSKIKKLLTKMVLREADLITCDGKNINGKMCKLLSDKRILIKYEGKSDLFPIANKKIKLILFGTDTNKFKPDNKHKNGNTVISLRNLENIYDIDTLILSAYLVTREYPNTKFIICGEGSEKQRLIRRVERLAISDNVEFIGKVESEKLQDVINSADIYVSTSLSDGGLAASTAEAMACGLPAVVTDYGVNKEWVKDGVNGFTFPMKDSKALAEKIVYLLENEDKRKEFGKNGRDLIVEKLNYEKEMKKMEELYKGLLKR